MSESYGNIGWQIFVYSSYIVVALSLVIYVILSISSRNKSLKDMNEEGFFQDNNCKNPPFEENKK
ncbi:hypothetical protein [Fluviispira sanaruensis]|uniref:CcoQ/FixQ family Cbb3-type cytochrome c oxidase assembly chaperone n=1 Tax=Fluviispira sanaruensis TaxID=2493639 RepID=A0A4P2VGK0_FLUSA|nr:hypothetical protein [Fluviispira sanaruensis]BBH51896.1 hypothetical protein JCM31447_03210 [Fluviispira sanaruensis]